VRNAVSTVQKVGKSGPMTNTSGRFLLFSSILCDLIMNYDDDYDEKSGLPYKNRFKICDMVMQTTYE